MREQEALRVDKPILSCICPRKVSWSALGAVLRHKQAKSNERNGLQKEICEQLIHNDAEQSIMGAGTARLLS